MQHPEIPTIVLEIATVGRARERREITARRTIIGRESGDIVLGDPEASALHAEIDCSDGHVIVRDLGSFNGTLRDGKRLPQFALFAGQTFRCGQTDITLVDVRGGADVPRPGHTAISTSAPGSSSTLPGLGAAPPGSSVTLPAPESIGAGEGRPQTLVRGSVQSAPEPETVTPTSTLVGLPTPGKPAHPVAYAGPTLPGDVRPNEASGAPPPAAAPSTSSTPETIFRPPVANAVIKPGSSDRGTHRPGAQEPKTRRNFGPILVWIGLAVGCIGGLVGIITLAYTLLAGRELAFVERVAGELPRDAVGVVVLRSPRAGLDVFGEAVDAELRTLAKDSLGLDPFDARAWSDSGVDIDAPLGLSVLHVEDEVFALSIGVVDAEAVRERLVLHLRESSGSTELRWVERELGKTKVEWLDQPVPIAALERKKRMLLVWSTRSTGADAVARAVQGIAELEKGNRLVDGPGFEALVPPDGETLVMGYVDGASTRASISGGGLEQIAIRTALADFDGFALAISRERSQVHFTFQTVLREGATSLALAGERRVDGKHALRRVPAPVLAELDASLDPAGFEQALSNMSAFGGMGLRFVEEQIREELDIDLRADLLRNLSGDLGYALLQLPPSRDSKDVRVLAWIGVADERTAAQALEKIYAKTREGLGARTEAVGGTTIYLHDGPPRVAVLVHEGHIWAAVGEVDLRSLLDRNSPSFLDAPRHPSVADALRSGGTAAGFVDVRELVTALAPLLAGDEAGDEVAAYAAPLETATFRAWTKKRAMVSRFSLHTSADDALETLVQTMMKRAGGTLATEARRARRSRTCSEVLEHVRTIALREGENGPNPEDLWRIESDLASRCWEASTSDAYLDCLLRAEGAGALRRCDPQTHTEVEKPSNDGDPLPVPYVDDIWPRTQHDGGSAPARDVNYAVDLGRDPQARGPEDALVTIVELGDFECPYCRQVATTLDEVLAEHGHEVRLVFRHNPLPGHPNARIAAQAAIAAGRQGKFWQMHDKLFEHPFELNEANFRRWAVELGLDATRFDRDFYDAATQRQIDDDIEAAKQLASTGTPAFFVNGRYLPGAQPAAAFTALIAEERARAQTFVERRGNTRKHLYRDMIAHFAPGVPPPALPVPDRDEDERHLVSAEGLPVRGASAFARVQIIACSDFDCPFCARVLPTIEQVLDHYPQVAFHFAHNPLPFHKQAEPAARAAIAADRQSKFWEMHDELFANQKLRSDDDLEAMARTIGLDVLRWKRDMSDESTTKIIEANKKLCNDNGARGTPSFFINGRLLTGAQPFASFQALIDEELTGIGGI